MLTGVLGKRTDAANPDRVELDENRFNNDRRSAAILDSLAGPRCRVWMLDYDSVTGAPKFWKSRSPIGYNGRSVVSAGAGWERSVMEERS